MTTEHTTLAGVPFLALYHHDGRFLRLPGLFAFARWKGGGRYQVPHLELAEDIARAAGPGHPRWGWALQARMDTLLIHLLGAAHALPEPGQSVEADWHPDACVALGADEDALAAVTLLVTAQA